MPILVIWRGERDLFKAWERGFDSLREERIHDPRLLTHRRKALITITSDDLQEAAKQVAHTRYGINPGAVKLIHKRKSKLGDEEFSAEVEALPLEYNCGCDDTTVCAKHTEEIRIAAGK